MLRSSFWLKSRLPIIYAVFIDILLFIGFLLGNGIFKLENKIIIFNFFFLMFWVLVSYVIGRYHKTHLSIIDPIKQIFLSISNFFVIFSIVYFFYYKILKYNYSNGFTENFIICIIYIASSFLCQSFFHRFFKKNLESFQEWSILGSFTFFSECKKLIKNSKIKLNYISIDKIFYGNKFKNNILIEDLNQYTDNDKEKIVSLNYKGSNIVSIINWCEIVIQRIPLDFLSSYELLNLFSYVYSEKSFQIRLKRVADIVLSIFIILITFPILIISGLFIYLEDKGPVLYFQKRVGKNGNNFKICKLRTMNINAEKKGARWSQKNDLRVTNIGKFLRSSRIDELPQLFSVLVGDMSLIGPRPERPEIDLILKEQIPFYDLRYLIRPGLSGWAQVNLPYGSSVNDSESKLTYDFFYIKNFSFWLDMLIFFRTIRLVLRREGSIPK